MPLEECMFCQIGAGKIKSITVYEDTKCRAILDINPANPGHVLLIPKEHHVVWQLMPDDLVSHLALVSRDISKVMLSVLGVKGVNIYMANGEAAGQKAPHFIMHIIPRQEGDEINFMWQPKKLSEDEMKVIGLKLAEGMKKFVKQEEKPVIKEEKKEEISEEELPKRMP